MLEAPEDPSMKEAAEVERTEEVEEAWTGWVVPVRWVLSQMPAPAAPSSLAVAAVGCHASPLDLSVRLAVALHPVS